MNISMLKYFAVAYLLCLLSFDLKSQETTQILNYSDKKTYEIGGINIVGAENRDRNAIKSITGLKEGGKVQIPGPSIPAAIKSVKRP